MRGRIAPVKCRCRCALGNVARGRRPGGVGAAFVNMGWSLGLGEAIGRSGIGGGML